MTEDVQRKKPGTTINISLETHALLVQRAANETLRRGRKVTVKEMVHLLVSEHQ
jgi:hypothetical protein